MYLDHWKKTVDDRNDCEDDDKKHMVLSRVTDRVTDVFICYY